MRIILEHEIWESPEDSTQKFIGKSTIYIENKGNRKEICCSEDEMSREDFMEFYAKEWATFLDCKFEAISV